MLQLGDLFLGGLAELCLELIVHLVGGEQLQAFLFGGERKVVLPRREVAVSQAVLRVRRRGERFGIELEELQRVLLGLGSVAVRGLRGRSCIWNRAAGVYARCLQSRVGKQVDRRFGKNEGIGIAFARVLKNLRRMRRAAGLIGSGPKFRDRRLLRNSRRYRPRQRRGIIRPSGAQRPPGALRRQTPDELIR